ncbi:MAG: universal stress protein [bacterium]
MTYATMLAEWPMDADGSAVRGGPVIVAASDREVATIMRAGERIAKQLRRQLAILSVIEPVPAHIWNSDGSPIGGLVEERVAYARRRLTRAIVPNRDLAARPVEVLCGDVSHTLARVAHERQVPYVVMGIGRHRAIDRLLGGDTVLRTARLAECPVLAVAHSFRAEFTSAAVGTDFSRSSAYAAQSVASLLASPATLHLVHVWQPSNTSDDESLRDDDAYRHHLAGRFKRFIGSLDLPPSIEVKCEVREGHPAQRLVDFADAHRVDLIAVGRNGHNALQRLLVGGVAERVIRSAECSVLIAPDRPLSGVPPVEPPDGSTEAKIERREWEARLADFARHNAGRVAVLDVNDPEHGVVSAERGYILFGTSYNAPSHLVLIALGETHGRRQHRTRYVSDADRLSIVRDTAGADVALRIHHDTGETVLSLLPRTPTSHAQ